MTYTDDSILIRSSDQLVMKVKDTAGNLLQFAGKVIVRDGADILSVAVQDIARLFPGLAVTRRFTDVTLGQVIEGMVENPTGSAATGITAHCDEIPLSGVTGEVVRVKLLEGKGKSLAYWLSKFVKDTGFRWTVEWQTATGWHFYWFDPLTAPLFAATVKDDIDYGAESASQWRVEDGSTVTRDSSHYANRVRYKFDPLAVSTPAEDGFDTYMAESTTGWTAWNALTTLTAPSTPAPGAAGTKSLLMTWNYTPVGTEAWPTLQPLAYFPLPQSLQNMTYMEFGQFQAWFKIQITVGGVVKTPTQYPQSSMCLFVVTTQGEVSTPALFTRVPTVLGTGSYWVGAAIQQGTATTWTSWAKANFMLPRQQVYQFPLAYQHVVALGLGYYYWGDAAHPRTTVAPVMAAGVAQKIEVWMDSPAIIPNSWEAGGGSSPIGVAATDVEGVVETAAVTAGTEVPCEVQVDYGSVGTEAAAALAQRRLDYVGRDQVTVSTGPLVGMRNIGMRNRVTLALADLGIYETYPLLQATWRPLENGDATDLLLGDIPFDEQRSVEYIVRALNG